MRYHTQYGCHCDARTGAHSGRIIAGGGGSPGLKPRAESRSPFGAFKRGLCRGAASGHLTKAMASDEIPHSYGCHCDARTGANSGRIIAGGGGSPGVETPGLSPRAPSEHLNAGCVLEPLRGI